jgi:hypothetical protein
MNKEDLIFYTHDFEADYELGSPAGTYMFFADGTYRCSYWKKERESWLWRVVDGKLEFRPHDDCKQWWNWPHQDMSPLVESAYLTWKMLHE